LTITTGDITENRIRIPEINLISGDNQLRIYKEQEQIYRETIRYNPPDIRVSGLGSWEKIGDFYILKGLNELILGIKEAPVICAANGGLNKIKYYLNDLLIDSLTQMQAGGGTDIQINNFNGGINTLTFEIEGNFDGDILDKYPEYRELDTKEIMFFYIDFELPESLWKQDTFIKLSGNPAGGWFTGKGIIENSSYFNPKDANLGMNIITYHYPLDGEIVSVTREIDVKSHNFSVEGDLSVCRNSMVQYEILNFDSDNFNYDWEVENGGIQIPTGIVDGLIAGKQLEYIKWNTGVDVKGNFGYITVTATHKISDKQFIEKIKVYIKESEAKGIPHLFFGDTENRLVICDNPDAAEYIWIKDDEPEITTDYNYIYFDSPGTEFRLILETLEGCRTEGFLSVNENSVNAVNKSMQNQIPQNLTNKGFSIYPNPAQNKLNLLLKEPEGAKKIQIYNSISQVMFETALKEGHIHKVISVSEYPPGQYIIKITQGNSFVTGQFIKTN
jgi:hypothetical protein